MNSTLNRVFRVIWCKVRLAWVAVSEIASGHGKVQSSTRRVNRTEAGAEQAWAENTRALWDGDHMRLVPLMQPLPLGTRRWIGQQIQRTVHAINTRHTLLASAIASGSAMAAPPAAPTPSQLPTGGQLSAGSASIGQSGANMVIQQGTDRAAIHWQTFNVGSNAQVQFNQPGTSSVTLNRVMSSDPSQIFGRITANGQVILTNPSGVYFGPSARVDVGGLVATTHGISNTDFMAGSNKFERQGSTASVVNEGELKASLGGYIALLAPEVRNQGAVIAQMGTVALASGEAIDLKFDSNNRLTSLRVEPSQIAALVDNRHAVQAPGGLVIISAQSMDRLAGGVVKNSGAIEANSLTAKGGRIVLEADHIKLQSGSRIDASGATGGGTVLVGGDWQGSGDMHQATTVTMEQGASIDASATSQGDGGKVVLWSDVHKPDSVTTAQGSVSAKGGAQGGNGGQVETSGHSVNIDGFRADTRSASDALGKTGLWLIDPYDYTIDMAQALTISSALNGSDVTVTTATYNASYGATGIGSDGNHAGNITLNYEIYKYGGGSTTTLTLSAANELRLLSHFRTVANSPLNLVLDAGAGQSVLTGTLALSSGSLTKQGAGTLTLSSSTNSYTGGTTVLGGTLSISADANLGSVPASATAGALVLDGGSLQATANLTLNANRGLQLGSNGGTVIVDSGQTLGYGGAIAGSGTLTKAGAGTLSLTGISSYSGNTSLSAGTLALMGTANNNGNISMGSAGTLAVDVASGNTLTYAGNISGAGTFTKTGAGSLVLTGSNTYTGSSTISAGALVFEADAPALPASVFTGAGTLEVRSAGASFSSPYTFSANTSALGGLTLGRTNNTQTVTIATATSLTDNLLVNGPAKLGANITTGGSQTYTGDVTVSAESVALSAMGGGGTGNGLVFGGNINGMTTDTNHLFLLSGAGNIAVAGGVGNTTRLAGLYLGGTGLYASALNQNYAYTGGVVIFTAPHAGSYTLTLNGASGGHYSSNWGGLGGKAQGTITLQAGDLLYVVVGGSGTNTLTYADAAGGYNGGGTGNWVSVNGFGPAGGGGATHVATASGVLSSLSSQTGSILLVAGGGGGGSASGSGSVGGGTNTNGTIGQGTTPASELPGGGGGYYGGNAGEGGSSYANTTLLSNTSLTAGGNTTYGNGSARITSPALSTFTPGNQTGAIRIEGGVNVKGLTTASVAADIALANSSGNVSIASAVTFNNTGSLQLGSGLSAQTATVTGALVATAPSQVKLGTSVTTTTTQNYGAVELLRDVTLSLTGTTSEITGIVSGTGGLTKAGTGTLTLSGANTYSGSTTVNDGTLKLGASDVIPDGSALAIGASGTLELNGKTDTVNAITGTGIITNSVAGGLLTWGSAADFTFGGSITGATNLAKAGSGDAILTGNTLSYTGATTINAGRLVIQNDAPSSTVTGTSGFSGAGTLVVEPAGTSFTSAYTFSRANSGLTNLTLGKSGNTQAITLSGAQSLSGSATVYAGNITLNAALAADTITLVSSGNVSSGASGYVSGSNLLLQGGNVTLGNASNAISTLAASGVGNLSYSNSTALAIDTVSSTQGIAATGTVSVSTNTGDLGVNEGVATTLASSATALTLNAGASSAAGTATGGNIVVTGSPNITVGSGSKARLFSGNVADSSGLSALEGLGLGSGRFRYNSDESSTGYTQALTAGLNAIYREAPSVTVSTGALTMTYGDALPGMTAPGALNGDASYYTITGRVNSTSGNIRASATPYTIASNLGLLGYSATGSVSATLTVNAKALTMTGLSSQNKVYDGTTTAVVSGTAVLQTAIAAGSGSSSDGKAYTGDTVTLSGTASGSFNSKNVADATTVNFSGLSLSGADAANYTLTQPSASHTITAKALSMSGLTVTSKTYDGTTSATLSGTATLLASEAAGSGSTSDGKPYTGDTVAFTGTAVGTYNSKDVASANAVTFSGLALDNGNYSLTVQTPAAATITAKALTISGLSSQNKVYDGTTDAVVNGTAALQTAIAAGSGSSSDGKGYSGDVFSLSGTASGSFNSKDVATATTVNFSGLSLSGADAANYTLTQPSASHTITAKALTMSGLLVPISKTYDGTTSATVGGTATLLASEAAGSGSTSDGKPYTGDTVAFTGTAVSTYNSKDVASANAVTFSGLALNNGNYSLTVQAPTSATITAKALTISGLSSQNKVYDGTTDAIVNGTAVLQTAIAAGSGSSSDGKAYTGDTVSLSGTATGSFNNKDVLNATTVNFSGLSLSGADAANYTLTQHASASQSITAKALTISGLSSQNKVYDGTTDAIVNGTAVLQTAIAAGSGNSSDGKAYTGDTVSLSGTATGNFNNKDVLNATTVNFSGLSLSGADAANYTLTAHASDTTARITPAHLTVTANDDAKFVTQSDRSGFNGVSMTGFVHGETASVMGGAASVSRSNAATNMAGVYDDVLQATGLTSGNYDISYLPGKFTIVPSNQLLVTVNNLTTSYGSAAQYAISRVQYEDNGTIYTLGSGGVAGSSVSVNASNQVAIVDGAGGSASFALAPRQAVSSTGNQLAVGNYQLGTSGTVTENSVNFSNIITVVGAHQVNTKGITASASNVSKVYDGNTSMTGVSLNLATLEAGDVVTVDGRGTFSSRNAGTGLGYTLSNLVLSGADAANYHLTGGISFAGNNGAITARPLTVSYAASNKTYDGNTTVTVAASDNRVSGDALSVSQSAAFADKNVGMGKSVGISGITLAGADAGNYSVANPGQAAQTTADITRLNSVSWVGGASGNWLDPANWAGGAVPDLSNVAHVVLPAGVTVTFNNTATSPATAASTLANAVNIDSLGSLGGLQQTEGFLNIGSGGMTLASFSQSGGATAVTGNFTVNGDYSQGPHGSVTVGGNTSITDTSGGMSIGNLRTAGSTHITSTGGDITQSAGTAVVSVGVTTLAASNNGAAANIRLDGAGNDFQGAVNATGAHVSLTDANALTLGTVNTTGDLAHNSHGALDMGTTTVGGNLSANSSNGDITQSGALTVAGTTSLDAGTGDITLLNSGNDFTGAVSANGDVIQIYDRNALTLGTVNAAGNLTLTSHGALDMGTTTVGGNLRANSGNGHITQSGALTVAGTTGLDAGTGNITLLHSGNDFLGAVSANGDVVQINDRNALTLGTVNATGNLTLTSHGALDMGTTTVGGDLSANSSNGNMTQTGPLRVKGLADFDAGTGTVLLPNPNNELQGGARTRASYAVVMGDARKTASDAAAKAQSNTSLASATGTLLNANAPAPLAIAPAQASGTSGGGSSAAPAPTAGNSAGVTVDLHSVGQQETPFMVSVSLPKSTSTVGLGFSFEMPETVKSMATQDAITQITQPNGSPLPSWLKFDKGAMRFEAAAVPDSALPMQLVVEVAGRRVAVVISERTE